LEMRGQREWFKTGDVAKTGDGDVDQTGRGEAWDGSKGWTLTALSEERTQKVTCTAVTA